VDERAQKNPKISTSVDLPLARRVDSVGAHLLREQGIDRDRGARMSLKNGLDAV